MSAATASGPGSGATSPTAARFTVVCPVFRTGPIRSRAAAERLLAKIERTGACAGPHEIVEVR